MLQKLLHNKTAKLYASRDRLEFSGGITVYDKRNRKQARRVLERALAILDRYDAKYDEVDK